MADCQQRLSMETKMAVMTMRTQGNHSNAKEVLRMKEQLKSCLELGSDIPGIWFWALGPTSGDDATPEDAGSKPETESLWQEIANLLRCAPKPVLGVAVGRVGMLAATVLGACDYVLAAWPDTPQKAHFESAQAWLDTPQKPHLELADVVIETTEALYEKCERMARQIEKLNREERARVKMMFRCLRPRSKLEHAGKVSASVRCGSADPLACKRRTHRGKLNTVPEENFMI
eukprot:TRINITY_DN5766_c0_g1_i1.p1 TRINITY_DN5766_c0_g1~~TRINITY_DN5766_c0_g1_i1.p1  ORF type:complete len:231 (-),score=34.95 TRINITY_DN5766_c0_g1_i1:661-1353(-)